MVSGAAEGRGGSRRQQILEALARELEGSPGSRITTARLAREVGVSEAALYRHFPSKAKMFEALIAFAEDTVFERVAAILDGDGDAGLRCERIAGLLLGFSRRNPGITRILLGDALVGENERLRARVVQFFDRMETQLRQVLRESEHYGSRRLPVPVPEAASLIMALVEGRMVQFARSDFKRPPDADWERQWGLVREALFAE